MTRKRFVKLLMSEGLSRNEANDLATDVDEGYSYDELYCIHCVLPTISDAIERTGTAIKCLVQGICDIIPTVVQAITEILPVALSILEKAEKEMEVPYEKL